MATSPLLNEQVHSCLKPLFNEYQLMANTVAIRANTRPNGRYEKHFDDLILNGKLQGIEVLFPRTYTNDRHM